MEIFKFAFFQKAILSGFLAGISCGIVGVWVLLLRISFIGVAISHSAFAGALLGILLNKPFLPFSFLFSFIASGILGPLSDKGKFHPDTSLGIIFSTTLGLSFLFMGALSGAKSEALNLLWGSILTIDFSDIVILFSVVIFILLIVFLFYKEIQSVIFNKTLAKASGIPATGFFYLLLFMSGIVITACLKSIGGLLVFSLIINPAASAYQITYNLKKMYVLSCLFGVISCWTGLFISTIFNIPSGASIVLVSAFIFIISNVFSPKKWKKGKNSLMKFQRNGMN